MDLPWFKFSSIQLTANSYQLTCLVDRHVLYIRRRDPLFLLRVHRPIGRCL